MHQTPASRTIFVVLSMLFLAGRASAGQAWLEVGDARLRGDLQMLADAGVIDLPLTAWPIPVADIDRVLANAQSRALPGSAYDAALARVRVAIRPRSSGSLQADLLRVSAGNPSILRDFDSAAREKGEITAGIAMLGNRWAAEVRGTLTTSPDDDRNFRLDGSHVTLRLGNWLVGANTLDRWWGAGNVSSLILSNNARPIPALMVERATSVPFKSKLLHWIGPWRVSILAGQMESDRQDVERPLFMGMRISVRPWRFLEVGLSRSAQFCGEGRRCTLDTLVDVIGFNDTAAFSVAPEDEPGNQLAGWEIRFSSPWQRIPVALYTQRIGEDRIDLRPTDRLELHGIEAWHSLPNGDVLRGYVEYSDTACAASADFPNFNCAYDHHIFFADGYRSRGRPIGHTTDGDSLLRAAGLRWARGTGGLWSIEVRDAALNRDTVPDPRNTMGATASDYQSAELGWRGSAFGGELSVQLGHERIEPLQAEPRNEAFGFLSWQKNL